MVKAKYIGGVPEGQDWTIAFTVKVRKGEVAEFPDELAARIRRHPAFEVVGDGAAVATVTLTDAAKEAAGLTVMTGKMHEEFTDTAPRVVPISRKSKKSGA